PDAWSPARYCGHPLEAGHSTKVLHLGDLIRSIVGSAVGRAAALRAVPRSARSEFGVPQSLGAAGRAFGPVGPPCLVRGPYAAVRSTATARAGRRRAPRGATTEMFACRPSCLVRREPTAFWPIRQSGRPARVMPADWAANAPTTGPPYGRVMSLWQPRRST